MKASRLVLAAVLPLLGCGGVEGEPVDTGASTSGLDAISSVPYWVDLWQTDVGNSPLSAHATTCTFGEDLAPVLAGGFVLDLDRHFRGQTGPVRRTCSLAADLDVLVPLVTVSMDGAQAEVKPPERVLATRVEAYVSSVRNLEVLIDGQSARSLELDFVRTGPESYRYILPDGDPLWTPQDGDREIELAVADGIFMVLPGLLAGHHQLVIMGEVGGRPFHVEYAISAN